MNKNVGEIMLTSENKNVHCVCNYQTMYACGQKLEKEQYTEMKTAISSK